MNKLMEKLIKTGATTGAEVMAMSSFFAKKDIVRTDCHIVNIAFSGDLDGGLLPGLTVLAGASKSFKSAMTLYCLKAYLDKYDDAIGLFYDTEAGISLEFMQQFGIDTNRVLHIPIEHVEQLKFDMIKKLDSINKGDHVFIMVDSIGQISSKKEVEDTLDEKSAVDMTRAKAIRSLLRLATIQFAKKDIPCIMINHVYEQIGGMFPQKVIPGGTAVMYSANQVWIITKAQEKSATGIVGWNFTINIEKSRMVREKSKLTFQVIYNEGIKKYSGILDLAIESGHIIKPSAGWYQLVDTETGEVIGQKMRAADTGTDEVLGRVVKDESFKAFIRSKYKLANGALAIDESAPEFNEDEI